MKNKKDKITPKLARYVGKKYEDNPYIQKLAQNKLMKADIAMKKNTPERVEKDIKEVKDKVKSLIPKKPEPKELSPERLEFEEKLAAKRKKFDKALHHLRKGKNNAK